MITKLSTLSMGHCARRVIRHVSKKNVFPMAPKLKKSQKDLRCQINSHIFVIKLIALSKAQGYYSLQKTWIIIRKINFEIFGGLERVAQNLKSSQSKFFRVRGQLLRKHLHKTIQCDLKWSIWHLVCDILRPCNLLREH